MATITGAENIENFRIHTLIAALAIEVQTGMKRSNGGRSTLTLLREAGVTDKKTKNAALIQIVDRFDEHGLTVRPTWRTAYATAKTK